MLKQQYSTKQHSFKAWMPLNKWLHGKRSLTDMRMKRLMSFGTKDKDIHSLIGRCLWSLANGANHPWGVVALKPRGYSAVKTARKVVSTEYPRGLLSTSTPPFFFIHFHLLESHVNPFTDPFHMICRLGPLLLVSVSSSTRYLT